MQRIRNKARFSGYGRLALALLAAVLMACEAPVTPGEARAQGGRTPQHSCGDAGFLAASLYGSIERNIEWQSNEVRCESMLRPDGEGIRLRFAGNVAKQQLAFILALPRLERGSAASESPTVVTFTVEGSGRFFSTASLGDCWSDIAYQEAINSSANRYDIAGTLYCVAPLGEINGDAAISIPQLAFRGIADWGAT